jgi:hypothetical protein
LEKAVAITYRAFKFDGAWFLRHESDGHQLGPFATLAIAMKGACQPANQVSEISACNAGRRHAGSQREIDIGSDPITFRATRLTMRGGI